MSWNNNKNKINFDALIVVMNSSWGNIYQVLV
jgi:hypothetical protein